MNRELSALLKLTGLVLQITTFVIATKSQNSFHESAVMPSFARSGNKQKSKRYERGSCIHYAFQKLTLATKQQTFANLKK